jgi:hypothetical protein
MCEVLGVIPTVREGREGERERERERERNVKL